MLAFGVSLLGLTVFWLRFALRVRRAGEVLPRTPMPAVWVRIGCYSIAGLCAILVSLTMSQWFAWIGVAALVTKEAAESVLRRHHRRSQRA